MTKMLYGINDKPKTVKEWFLYALQQVLAIFVATVLICSICGTPISAGIFGAGIGTLVYQLLTRFKSPMFISNSGATVSAVISALALDGSGNYMMVAIGGLVVALIYCIFAIIVKRFGKETINKIFPSSIIGAITIVIGLNLAGFIPGYVGLGTAHQTAQILVALFTMVIVAVSSHYFKGFWKTIPFLIGLGTGYALSLILTLCGIPIVSFSAFQSMTWYPELTFLKWTSAQFSWGYVGQTILFFTPVALCAMLEHISDHKVLSNIVGVDLTTEPGLHRTLAGDGIASLVGCITCGQPNTSYGESVATTGFSKVASTRVISLAAIMMILLSFLGPLSAFVQSIPSCVFGGCAMVLYGYIAASGLKTLKSVDLENNKNLIIVSVILTIGVSGIWLFHQSFAGVSLAMIIGIVLNLILKERKPKYKEYTIETIDDSHSRDFDVTKNFDPSPLYEEFFDKVKIESETSTTIYTIRCEGDYIIEDKEGR